MKIRVDCYAGYRGEETPRVIWMGSRKIAVTEIMDRWLSPDHRYFKIRGDDRSQCILRHDVMTLKWELIDYQCDPSTHCPEPPLRR